MVLRPRKKPAVALTTDGMLPADVLYDVLIRLQANDLCRLRAVCRSWRSLTSDPGFARAHASRHPLLAAVAGVHTSGDNDREIRVVDLFSGDIVRRIAPVARPRYGLNSQLDMACVSAMNTCEPSSVLNLAAGEVIATFLPKGRMRERDIDWMSPFLIGHIPSTGELKVFYSHLHGVGGGHGHGDLVQKCCIKTLIGGGSGSRRWRATSTPPAILNSGLRACVVIKGVAYILVSLSFSQTKNNHDILELEPDDIAVFDMAAEQWRPTLLWGPLSFADDDERRVQHEHSHQVQLAVLDDCLVTVHNQSCYQDCSMDLWFLVDMDVDKGLWTKRFSIRRATLGQKYACNGSYPLLLLDDGRIIMWEDIIQVLKVYDLRINKWDDITTLANYSSINMYRGNLLCPGLQR